MLVEFSPGGKHQKVLDVEIFDELIPGKISNLHQKLLIGFRNRF